MSLKDCRKVLRQMVERELIQGEHGPWCGPTVEKN